MRYPGFLLCLLLLLSACGGHKTAQAPAPTHPDDADRAERLSLYRDGGAWVARVANPADTAAEIGVYIFPDTDTTSNLPKIEGAYTFTPSQRRKLLVYSGVHTAALKELGALDAVTMVGDAQYFTDPDVLARLRSGRIQDAGAQENPVAERVIAAKPDMILLSYYPGLNASAITRLGIPVLWMCESQENSPLGRAQWLKLLGLIANDKAGADSICAAVQKEYAAVQKKAQGATRRPKVMAETMYQGSWGTAGGRSYAARLIADAGGDYVFRDDTSDGTIQLGFEQMLARAKDADIWLIRVFGYDLTLPRLKAIDERNMLFRPAQTGGVWGANTQAVPFFEETPFHPDLALKDYLAIFHPELAQGYTPRYFKRAE